MSEEYGYKKIRIEIIDDLIILDHTCNEILDLFSNKGLKYSIISKLINISTLNKALVVIRIMEEAKVLNEELAKNFKEKIKTCCEIRNIIAHKLPYSHYKKDIIDYAEPSKLRQVNYLHKNQVKPLIDLAKNFKRNFIEVVGTFLTYLDSLRDKEKFEKVIKDLARVKIYLRNYKGWFMDILELKLEDSKGQEYNLYEYPLVDYSTEDFEDDVKKDVKEYLGKIKGIDLSKTEIEISDDIEYIEAND